MTSCCFCCKPVGFCRAGSGQRKVHNGQAAYTALSSLHRVSDRCDIYVCLYVCMLAPKIYRSGGSWGRGVHEITVMLKHTQNFRFQNSRNTVILKKFKIIYNAGIYGCAGDRFPKILFGFGNLLNITVFPEF